ncbi:SMP-30/gluconolactonase/LRE family protein [Actinomadura barringtoniae]|uniref:SMP-30/gluconolactonase/LRE family protein n=1 Tax=Actinomadura barringtoniae TaxID=1427535 RepID=A0A939P7C5_9ACTN|nr:SMP-30/gluconolactonase/LRE family protein [Actinomadura barringtoniae]MBO2447026.1 SMP-30/gluconolactonase/LRE family protein [Actinomadura barringtoniae]
MSGVSTRSIAVATVAAAAAAALPFAPVAAQAAAPAASPKPAKAEKPALKVSTAYVLPGEHVYPEGIAVDPRNGDLYAASYTEGTVFKMTRGHRVAKVFKRAGADGRTTANGLKIDRAGRLWVTDSTHGVAVYNTRTRRLFARFEVPGTAARFVNDLSIARDGSVYLTDSVREVVYRVTPTQLAGAHKSGKATKLQARFNLTKVIKPHPAGAFTLNGIVTDPSGRYALTVDSTAGELFRLDLASGKVRKVALRGGGLVNADGLELKNGRLWAAHNKDYAISRWRVGAAGASARREAMVTSKALELPTTLVRSNGVLYVVRSQFDKGGPMGPGTPRIPFSIAAVKGF